MALGVNGATSVPEIDLAYLTDLSLLSEQWGTYETFIEAYPTLAKQSYILQTEASERGIVHSPTRKFKHWEAGRDLPFIQSTAVVSALAGASATMILTAGSHTHGGAQSPVAVGFVFENYTSGQVYRVEAIDKSTAGAHSITIAPRDTTDTIAIAVDDYLLYRGNVYVPEGSEAEDGLYRDQVAIEGEVRTVRSDKVYTDRVLFEKTASPAGGYKFKDADIEWERTSHFIAVQEMLLMLGKDANNLGSGNAEGQGLVTQVREYANNLASGAVIDEAFWQGLKRYFDADGYSNELDMLMDTEMQIKAGSFLRANYTDGAIKYGESDGESGRPMSIASNFNSYDVDGIRYNMSRYHYFNPSRSHGVPLGTDGQTTNFALFVPVGLANDAKSGQPVRRFAVRYNAESAGMPAINVWTTGAYSPTNKTDKAVLEYHAMANKGLQVFGLNGYGWAQLA